MGKIRNDNRILVVIPLGKSPLGRTRKEVTVGVLLEDCVH
jgi:hypothetical protein